MTIAAVRSVRNPLEHRCGVGDLCRAKTSLGVVSWPFTEVRLPCGIR
jgi:hypothetical protein